jgi:hypothetical protein
MGEVYRAKDGRVARQAVRSLVVLVLVLAVLTLTCCGRPEAAEITLVERMNAALAAKRLCSAVWVSDRAEEEARRTSVFSFIDETATARSA